MKHLILAFALLFSVTTCVFAEPSQKETVTLLDFKGPIGPASVEYFRMGLKQAAQSQSRFLIFQLNTPGGLMTSMRDIIEDILSASMPVVVYVAPSGARASSAGTYILYASNIAVMAPGTHLGAATPVNMMAPEEKPAGKTQYTTSSTMKIKALEDATAYIRSLAQLRDRNVQWAEQAVLKGESISAEEALKIKVIDMVARDLPDLLKQIHLREIKFNNQTIKLDTQQLKLNEIEMDWRIQFLNFITDPNIAYILLLIGICGLFFEFTTPGLVVPGVVGAIAFLLALYALYLLPVNYAGAGLMLLGITMIAIEATSVGFGILGVGGIISFIIGSIFLLDRDVPGFYIRLPVVFAITGFMTAFFLIVMQLAARSHLRPIVSGKENLMGKKGRVIKTAQGTFQIHIEGEIWQVDSDEPLKEGEWVEVIQVKGLVLIVKVINNG